jgi:hypothetical protein
MYRSPAELTAIPHGRGTPALVAGPPSPPWVELKLPAYTVVMFVSMLTFSTQFAPLSETASARNDGAAVVNGTLQPWLRMEQHPCLEAGRSKGGWFLDSRHSRKQVLCQLPRDEPAAPRHKSMPRAVAKAH